MCAHVCAGGTITLYRVVRVGLLEEQKCKLRPEGRERGSPMRSRERDFQVKRVTFAKRSAQQRAGKHICYHSHIQ